MATKNSGLMERVDGSLSTYAGVGYALRLEFGSASRASSCLSAAIMAGVRCRIQTGLPCHLTTRIWPAGIDERSTSTGPPAAFSRSEGLQDAMYGTATAAQPAPPTAHAVKMAARRSVSTGAPGVC